MVLLENHDFWKEARNADAIVCTINTVVKQDGNLVMGAGIAKQFAEEFPWLPSRWGDRTITMLGRGSTHPFLELPTKSRLAASEFGAAVYAKRNISIIGIHTKLDWRKPSPQWLVDRSCKQLSIIVNTLDFKKVVMTPPGCGHGGLDWEGTVCPMLSQYLDDRFHVCWR